jgi:hypothetical protein
LCVQRAGPAPVAVIVSFLTRRSFDVAKIALLVSYYRFNEPNGIRLLTDRDAEHENLADVLREARRRFDEGYAAFLSAGGDREGAIKLLDRQLREAGKKYVSEIDTASAINVVGGIDMLERLGALKRNMYNGVYVSFIDMFPPSE